MIIIMHCLHIYFYKLYARNTLHASGNDPNKDIGLFSCYYL